MDSKRDFATVRNQDFLEQIDLHQNDERVAELNWLRIVDHYHFYRPVPRCLDRVHNFHRFYIEAMKVMNPIQAPRNGTVKVVMVDDAQPVEFGDPLVVLV